MNNIIKLDHVIKRFGKFVAVNDVSLNVDRNKVFGFLGHNGAGKSTIIKMLCGVYRPTHGNVFVAGINAVKHPEEVRKKLGYMSQRFALYDDLTITENLKFFARIYGLPAAFALQRIDELKRMTGLIGKDNDIVRTLSGGWKQRLALCCALIHSPKLLILDEPTAGVDPVSRRIFWQLIRSLAEKDLTVFVSTHYMDEAELCDEVGILFEGALIACDTPQNLIRNAGVKTLTDVFIKHTASPLGWNIDW